MHLQRLKSLNQFLYDYEQQSVKSYAPSLLFSTRPSQSQASLTTEQQLLFGNPENKQLKDKFERMLVS